MHKWDKWNFFTYYCDFFSGFNVTGLAGVFHDFCLKILDGFQFAQLLENADFGTLLKNQKANEMKGTP